MNLKIWVLALMSLLIITSCSDYTPEEVEYIKSIEERREISDEWMQDDPNSPFNYKGKIDFHGLNYYDVDPTFTFESKLVEYEIKDSIAIFGTKGEERSAIRIGYFPFSKDGKEHKLNVYANIGKDNSVYHSIWFTDQTTNNTTYGVGRYLPFKLNPDNQHIYKIDFNIAFNPYCAYSPDYSCAIPSKEDYLDIAIEAGEKKYHE